MFADEFVNFPGIIHFLSIPRGWALADIRFRRLCLLGSGRQTNEPVL